METAKGLFVKYREIILYLAVGAFTTAISYGMYFVFAWGLLMSPDLASAAADGVAILVAFPLNKVLVFQKKSASKKDAWIESGIFFATRIAFLFFSAHMMNLTVKDWQWNELIARAVVTILVVLMNYVVSKFIVFGRGGGAVQ